MSSGLVDLRHARWHEYIDNMEMVGTYKIDKTELYQLITFLGLLEQYR